ncbi:hypothetical protein [Microbacterium proteolyticum]|uniref:hypothetical protein n=1 Tax=Microbacterium proteolyticum TaxID=1572644 RepID=UPI0035C1467B
MAAEDTRTRGDELSRVQVLTIDIAMASITLVLTPIFYWTNSRRARLGNAPRRGA